MKKKNIIIGIIICIILVVSICILILLSNKNEISDGEKFSKEYLDVPYDTLTYIEDHTNNNAICYIKRVKARHLFQKLAENNWNYAEPGVLFMDRINEYNLNQFDDNYHIECTNPCSLFCTAWK